MKYKALIFGLLVSSVLPAQNVFAIEYVGIVKVKSLVNGVVTDQANRTGQTITCIQNEGGQGSGQSNSTGGGYVDTDGDGFGDTAARDYTGNPGDFRSSTTPGARVDGVTSINQYGAIAGTHPNGIVGRTTTAQQTGDPDGNTHDGDTGWNGGGTRNNQISELWDGDGCVSNCGGVGNSSGASSGTSNVIYTHFLQRGLIDRQTWLTNQKFTFRYLPAQIVRGYQFWAIPYVKLMRKYPLAEKIMLPIAQHRADELAYQQGMRANGSWRGKLVRCIFEPACYLIGAFVGEQDWESLWVDKTPQKQERLAKRGLKSTYAQTWV